MQYSYRHSHDYVVITLRHFQNPVLYVGQCNERHPTRIVYTNNHMLHSFLLAVTLNTLYLRVCVHILFVLCQYTSSISITIHNRNTTDYHNTSTLLQLLYIILLQEGVGMLKNKFNQRAILYHTRVQGILNRSWSFFTPLAC